MSGVLASWKDGAARRAIVEFVERTVLGGVPAEEQALDRAAAQSWTIVSVKHDWATVF